MPLIKFHVLKGRNPREIDRLLDVAHRAMVSAFEVPDRDRYQILTEHEPSHFKALDTGLDLPRTNKFLLLEVISRPRSRAEKLVFYETLCRSLERECDMSGSDLMVSFVQNGDEDWSFGHGRAQFLTGEL